MAWVIPYIRFGDCNNAFVPFPINIWLLFNVVVPKPPKETGGVPNVTLDAFKLFFNA